MSGRALLPSFALALALAGCTGVPWSEGAAEPEQATAGAFVRTLDQAGLDVASERLAELVAERWSAGVRLEGGSEDLSIDWNGLTLIPGAPRLALLDATSVPAGEPGDIVGLGLAVLVPIESASGTIELFGDALEAPCEVDIEVAAGELDVPLSLTSDKLGRVQGAVLQGVSYQALSDVTPNAILDADLSSCLGPTEPGAQLARLGDAFAQAATSALSDSLSAEVPDALGLRIAFGWSAAVNADAIGTGFLRTALRATSDLVARRGETLQVSYSLTVEADPHPCVGSLSLPAPRTELPLDDLPPGAALHVSSLDRLVAAGWLTGAACASHLGSVPIDAGEMLTFWPALDNLGDEAELTLELWPSALPRTYADPELTDGLAIETGRMRADIMVSFGGARWRGATVELDLRVSGALWIESGEVLLEPAGVEVTPVGVEGGLLTAPMPEAIDALIAPLIQALLVDRSLAQLPPALAPAEDGWVMIVGDHLTWPVQ